MKNFLNEMSALLMFLIAILLFYFAITINAFSLIVNAFIFIIAIFVLIKGCDRLDRELGIGEYKNDNDESES